MKNKLWIPCPKCSGVLFQKWDDNKLRQIYYKETMRCLTCGSDFNKTYLLHRGYLNGRK